MGTRRVRIRRPTHHHPPGNAARIEAERLQQRQKHLVQLIAITAPPLQQHFLLDAGQVDRHRQAHQAGEVLEGKAAHMAQLQILQGAQARRWRRVIAQALQVEAAMGQQRHGAILEREGMATLCRASTQIVILNEPF